MNPVSQSISQKNPTLGCFKTIIIVIILTIVPRVPHNAAPVPAIIELLWLNIIVVFVSSILSSAKKTDQTMSISFYELSIFLENNLTVPLV